MCTVRHVSGDHSAREVYNNTDDEFPVSNLKGLKMYP